MLPALDVASRRSDERGFARLPFGFWFFVLLAFFLHVGMMTLRFGQLPIAPALGDEVIINDAAASLAAGSGYAATTFSDSQYGIDRLFAHFPPLYPLTESVALRAFGFSVYSLRLTTTVMSVFEVGILALLFAWLCRRRIVHWTTAAAFTVLYSLCPVLIIRERMARMESMIGWLALTCMWTLLCAYSCDGRKNKWLFASGCLAGLCMAVHPEAVSLLPIFVSIGAIATVARPRVKLLSLALVAVVPVLVCLATFRGRSLEAFHQFHSILTRETPRGQHITQWAREVAHVSTLSGAVIDLLMFLVIGLLVAIITLFFVKRHESEARHFALERAFAVAALIEVPIILWVFGLNSTRYQFLVGPLLVGLAVVWKGANPLSKIQLRSVAVLTALEVCALAAYLHARANRVSQMDPGRFAPIIARLSENPACKVLATPSLWIDLRTAKRPFTVLYKNYDGESRWAKDTPTDPLRKFDVVLLDENDGEVPHAWQWAQIGRSVVKYAVGGTTVDVFYDNACSPSGVTGS